MPPRNHASTSSTPRRPEARVLDGSRVPTWSLSGDSLTRLLDQLDPDPRQAALQYERVRQKLVKLFEWRGARFPEDLADETIDRVARKIDEGVEIQSEDPYRYFCGVAFYVFKEVLSEQRKEAAAFDTPEFRERAVASSRDVEPLMPCLDNCLDSMAPRSRELILDYHRGEKRERIENRNRLARELGVSMNTLRIRAYRIRQQLEACVEDCSG